MDHQDRYARQRPSTGPIARFVKARYAGFPGGLSDYMQAERAFGPVKRGMHWRVVFDEAHREDTR